MPSRLTIFWRRISISAKVRGVFYRVMSAQLRLGSTSLETATLTTAMAMPSNKLAVELAKRVKRVVAKGGLITEDWRESCWLPPFESAMLILSEREGVKAMAEVFGDMVEESSKPYTIFNRVVLPNGYHFGVFAVACTFLWFFSDLLEEIAGRYPSVLESQMSYGASLWLRSNAIWVVSGIAAVIGLYTLITTSVLGPARQIIKPLVVDHDMRIAKRYLELCSKLAARGASHTDMTAMLGLAMTDKYSRLALLRLEKMMRGGTDYMKAVGQTMVPPEMAQILSGLAPAGERHALSPAYATVGLIIGEQMTRRYAMAASVLRFVLLATNALIILLLVDGMYGTTTDLTNVVGRRGGP